VVAGADRRRFPLQIDEVLLDEPALAGGERRLARWDSNTQTRSAIERGPVGAYPSDLQSVLVPHPHGLRGHAGRLVELRHHGFAVSGCAFRGRHRDDGQH